MNDDLIPEFFTVSEITKQLKNEIENHPHFTSIWVKGEIYNLTYHSSGHIYFTIKDDDAQLSAVFFRYANKNMKFKLEQGMSVLLFGGLTVFEKRGSYQMNVLQARPDGAGELQKRIEQLKKKLDAEGIFDLSAKKQLPLLPKRVGVVTSPTGAAIRDILKVALRRYPNIEIILSPAIVQGDGAAATIAAAIKELNKPEWGIDVIIAGRGGGSFEDLMPFNEEIVVRAFYNSRVPIISAVGHQIDHPLSDDAADAAAPTPSAAAEIAVPLKSDLADEINYHYTRIENALLQQLKEGSNLYKNIISKKIFRAPLDMVNSRGMLLDEIENRLISLMKNGISDKKERFLRLPDIYRLQKSLIRNKKHHFHMAMQGVDKMSPLNIMRRGYSITEDSAGAVIKSVENVKAEDKIEIRLKDGRIKSTVDSVVKGE
jgi:exodeoxyribonuclease VII large subunit